MDIATQIGYVLPISLEQGFAYSLVALGILVSFRILSFPDLTVDGSFALGGAVAARLIVSGHDPVFAIAAAMAGGFLAGMATGLLNTRLKINSLLAGILVMSILYSVNLRIMGRANIPLLAVNTIFTPLEAIRVSRYIPIILFFFAVVALTKILLDVFFRTQLGMAMRATGDNEQMIVTLGADTNRLTVLGLGLANALIALSGALIAQDQGFADAGMGIGMIVAGLASIIIGEALIRKRAVAWLTFAAVAGSVAYRLFITIGLRLGLAPTDLKMATGFMVIIALGLPALRKGKEGKLRLRGV